MFNLMLVAEYFDQMDKLTVVDGERQPAEVYDDFLGAVDAALVAANATALTYGGNKAKRHAQQNGNAKGIISAADVPLITNKAAKGLMGQSPQKVTKG